MRLESLRKDKKMKLQKMSESDIMEFDDTGSEVRLFHFCSNYYLTKLLKMDL